ncbi:hypothetical protein [Biostraticola tofi]|uniref:Uncharacterized protein n=1 Tax=Biostraticola tofi TaxID=466109 RepID=A0A4R3YNB8_9GAMM|nr:hypothetical protein [Biostraticola tofi]TCV93018.1 hypothetical protein EDC52_11050 [Biostraticola tofi]
MIIDSIMRLLFVLTDRPAEGQISGSDVESLYSTVECENTPVYIPSEVWQRVSELSQRYDLR